MMKTLFKAIPVTLIILQALVCTSFSFASNLSEITVAPDMKRIAVKFEGKIGSYSDTTAQNPSRLIIEVPGATIVKSPRLVGLIKESGLVVRTAKTPTSVRIVMDFGNGPLPEYKIRQMDGYLLVFLADAPLAVPVRNREAAVPVKPVTNATPRENPIISNSSDLMIKSAQVQDGKIVLQVARESNPGMLYRIDLGVDFDHLGFSSARIVQSKGAAVPNNRSARTGPTKHPAQQMISENSVDYSATE